MPEPAGCCRTSHESDFRGQPWSEPPPPCSLSQPKRIWNKICVTTLLLSKKCYSVCRKVTLSKSALGTSQVGMYIKSFSNITIFSIIHSVKNILAFLFWLRNGVHSKKRALENHNKLALPPENETFWVIFKHSVVFLVKGCWGEKNIKGTLFSGTHHRSDGQKRVQMLSEKKNGMASMLSHDVLCTIKGGDRDFYCDQIFSWQMPEITCNRRAIFPWDVSIWLYSI